jgi:hypothetical protein
MNIKEGGKVKISLIPYLLILDLIFERPGTKSKVINEKGIDPERGEVRYLMSDEGLPWLEDHYW